MRYLSRWAFGLLGLSLAALPMAAQEVKTFGGQATISLPAGPLSSKDWLDGQVGGGVGLHGLFGFQGGHAVVPRFDYTYFKKDEGGVERKVQMYQLGVDYNYFLSRQVNNGPYVGGGLGVGAAKFQLDGLGASSDDTPVTAYAAASAGWMFTPHVGAELRYTWSRYKPDVTGFTPRNYTGKPDVDAPTLNASVIFRL
jgi:hypothetical protein